MYRDFRNLAALAVAVLLVFGSAAQGQIPSALVYDGGPLPGGAGTITSISNSAQNSAGGYAFTVVTDVSTSHVWGNATGGPGTVLVSEGTYGSYTLLSFESFLGLSDDGTPAISPSAEHISGSPTGLDCLWAGTSIVQNEEDPIADIPGNFSTFNSRPGMTRDGEAYWVGGYGDIQGGSTQNRALFLGNTPTVLLKGGDTVTGVTEPLIFGSAIDFDTRVSELGSNYLTVADVDSASSLTDMVVVTNGAALLAGGDVVREGSPVPASIGGLPGETWGSFDFLGITEAGDYLVTGDTNTTSTVDEFAMVNGQIVLREGDSIDGFTVAGAIEGGYMNKDGDWAVTWDVVDGVGGNFEALILNGQVVLLEDDLVDWNNDGVIDSLDDGAFITGFTGLTALTLGARMGEEVTLCFTADVNVNGSTTEAAFRMPVAISTGIVAVDSFQFTNGTFLSGTLADISASDNDDIRAQRSGGDIQARVTVEFRGTSSTATPFQLEFTIEGAVFARSNVVQSIDMFNYDTLMWEQVDTRNASRLTDVVVTVSGSGDLSRFVEPGTLRVETRVRFVSPVQRQVFATNLDHAFWTIVD